MSAKPEPQFYKDFASGMITNVAQNLLPKNATRISMNFDADEQIGALTTRLGTALVGSVLQT